MSKQDNTAPPASQEQMSNSLTEAETSATASVMGLTASQEQAHPDDAAVDKFAARMKWKLARARDKGRAGWQDPSWTPEQISQALREHVEKGDPTDVANYCMFLAARNEPITSASQEQAQQPSGETFDQWLKRERPAGCVSDMERGWNACVLTLATPKPEPMTYEQIGQMYDAEEDLDPCNAWEAYKAAVRAVEAHHGITKEQA